MNTLTKTIRETQPRPTTRTEYFAQINSLVASGAFRVEDRRKTHKPTGRLYA